MKASTINTIGWICIAIWILALISGNVDIYLSTSYEAIGYNLGQVLFLIIGVICLIVAKKKEKRSRA